MNAEELKQIQAPLKALYKENPTGAKYTFRAIGTLLANKPSCRIETSFGAIDAGLHPAAGGGGGEACSGDLLLQSLVACAGVTLNVVATAMSIPLRSARIVVEGDGDFRGAMGITKDVAIGISAIRVRFEIDSTASDEQLAVLIRQTERYCAILQTLRSPPPVEVLLQRVPQSLACE